MAIRKDVEFTVAADGRSITPTVPQDGGVQGEHNATRAIFHVGENSVWENPDYTVYIECEDNAGNIDTTAPLAVEGGQVAVLLPLAWTQYGGISTLRLVAEGADGTIAYMAEGAVRFTSRQNASQKVDGLLKGRMAEVEQRANDALSGAEEAKEAAESAANDAAAANVAARAAAADAAASVEQAQYDKVYIGGAATFAGEARDAAVAAKSQAESAAQQASACAVATKESEEYAATAVMQCSRYVLRAESAAEAAEDAAASGGGTTEYNRINVRNYGAMGDGVTDDRQAIIDAFTAAKAMLPCEVYFPAGTYGISNGITVEMDYGTGGLLVRGAGRDITTIKYLESYDPNQPGNMWYAIRIWPVGMPDTKPTTEDDYLHDISYTGLTVYDTDPIAHAWNPAKGDPSKEETHGFDLHYCKRASVTDCNIINVGDEAIDICGCHDVVVMNNHLINCPAAGTAGGAISIGDGCKGVVVSGNTLNGSAADETLEDGTVLTKRNFGIAVESLFVPVSDVVITGNTIKNVRGNGVNIAATNAGSEITNVVLSNNVLTDCYNGIKTGDTNYAKQNITISDNIISGCVGDLDTDGYAIYTGTKTYNLLISGNKFHNIAGSYAVRVAVADNALLTDNLFSDIAADALYTSGDVAVRNCTFRNTGTVTASGQVIIKYANSANKLTVSGCRLTGVNQSKGIANADVVENTDIEFVNVGMALSGTTLSRVIGGRFIGGGLTLSKDGAVMRDVTIESATTGNGAVVINANGVSVTGCNIYVNTSKKAIYENDGKTGNLVANNVVNGKLGTTATLILADNEGTVCVNNVDLRTVTTA